MDCTRSLLPFPSLEFLRDLWIAKILFVEVKQVQMQAVFHLALAQIVQVRLPVPVVRQIFRYMPRQKNMPCVATIQHPLGDVDPSSSNVCFVVHIGDSVNRTAVNSHPHLDVRMVLQNFANLQRASRRLFRAVKEKSAIPSPVDTRLSLSLASAERKHSVLRTI